MYIKDALKMLAPLFDARPQTFPFLRLLSSRLDCIQGHGACVELEVEVLRSFLHSGDWRKLAAQLNFPLKCARVVVPFRPQFQRILTGTRQS